MPVCPRCKLPTIPGFEWCPHCHHYLKIRRSNGPNPKCAFCGGNTVQHPNGILVCKECGKVVNQKRR